ncbi:MAG: pre-peptidase C-terminal domain-containing protein [Chloroflexi bacterium]|nr:pre-peptidase C-terminal domain-containing protein [Chloroflexota bacterium]MCI0576558.1 pre-peptidase C-terminal domain-containing protein [Chloroflexota bacterium]MCI0643811.1 pre-peptidase C-terminal domain-containing protein [Chloroflexota bacterium]MCI0726091.1 pre-peptidase C-terminal domain-containing protein [Chloroflexota bacterium]
MRRQFILLFVLIVGTAVLVSAQDSQPEAVPLSAPLEQMVAGEWELRQQPIELEPVLPPDFLQNPEGVPAADTCSNASVLGLPDGGQTITNNMTESAADPILGCMWGSPPNPQGYRTVWYRFTPAVSGWVTIETIGSNYDTVLAIYAGSCASMVQLACNDDEVGFTSQVAVSVVAGQTYYVEVADWNFGASGDAVLDLSAWIEYFNNWEVVPPLMPVPRSRHAAVMVHDNLYVIAGQTSLSGNPVRTGRTDRFNVTSNTWTQLANMPGPDNLGYSNTTAAYLAGRIYLPAGYVGNNNSYDGTHWFYDIAGGYWDTAAPNNLWPSGVPAAYSWAVAATIQGVSGYYLTGGLQGPVPAPGQTTGWDAIDMTVRYSPSLDQWISQTPMSTGRFGHVAGLQNIGGVDYVCVAGGISQGAQGPAVEASTECFNTNTGQWSPAGQLNFPRYYAGSAVDPNGNWYVFGGSNAAGQSIPVTEMFNRASNSWIALDSRYDLGTNDPNQPSRPPRTWPRGGFYGNTLWVVGGHRDTTGGDLIISLVEKLFLPDLDNFLPIVRQLPIWPGEPDDNFLEARPLAFNQSQFHYFVHPDDYVDVFYFDVPSTRLVTIRLNHLGSGNDFDIHLYNSNKFWLASSTNIGNIDEVITIALGPGRYYVIVERMFPPPGTNPSTLPYEIRLEG